MPWPTVVFLCLHVESCSNKLLTETGISYTLFCCWNESLKGYRIFRGPSKTVYLDSPHQIIHREITVLILARQSMVEDSQTKCFRVGHCQTLCTVCQNFTTLPNVWKMLVWCGVWSQDGKSVWEILFKAVMHLCSKNIPMWLDWNAAILIKPIHPLKSIPQPFGHILV